MNGISFRVHNYGIPWGQNLLEIWAVDFFFCKVRVQENASSQTLGPLLVRYHAQIYMESNTSTFPRQFRNHTSL